MTKLKNHNFSYSNKKPSLWWTKLKTNNFSKANKKPFVWWTELKTNNFPKANKNPSYGGLSWNLITFRKQTKKPFVWDGKKGWTKHRQSCKELIMNSYKNSKKSWTSHQSIVLNKSSNTAFGSSSIWSSSLEVDEVFAEDVDTSSTVWLPGSPTADSDCANWVCWVSFSSFSGFRLRCFAFVVCRPQNQWNLRRS